jgi:hypothetical protein
MAEKPYLMAALLCERILQEKDEVLSAIRIADTFYVTVPKNLAPEVKPAIQLTMLLGFKKRIHTEAEKHFLTLRIKAPSGTVTQQPTVDLNFKADEVSGANLLATLQMGVSEFGVFQIEVAVDDEVVTVVPFRLLERPAEPAPAIH